MGPLTGYRLLNIDDLCIGHLLHPLFLYLALFGPCGEQHILSLLSGTDDQLQELLMVIHRIMDQREVC